MDNNTRPPLIQAHPATGINRYHPQDVGGVGCSLFFNFEIFLNLYPRPKRIAMSFAVSRSFVIFAIRFPRSEDEGSDISESMADKYFETEFVKSSKYFL